MEVAESSPLSGGKSENTFQKINTTWLATVKAFSGISTAHNALLNFPTHAGICRLYLYIMTPLHMQPQPQEWELKLKVGTCPDSSREKPDALSRELEIEPDRFCFYLDLSAEEGGYKAKRSGLPVFYHPWRLRNRKFLRTEGDPLRQTQRKVSWTPGGLQLLVLYLYEVCVQSHPWVHLSLERLLLPWADLCYLHPGFLINNYLGPTNPNSENCAKFCV